MTPKQMQEELYQTSLLMTHICNGDAFCSRCGQAITWEGKDNE